MGLVESPRLTGAGRRTDNPRAMTGVGDGTHSEERPEDHSDERWERLARVAREAAGAAYCRYSGVHVGAALLASDGTVYAGCNVENASYGLTICAERSALVRAVSCGARSFEAIAVWSDRPAPLMPCGACRQMLSELAPDLAVLCVGAGGGRVETSLAELLPLAFAPEDVLPGGPRPA